MSKDVASTTYQHISTDVSEIECSHCKMRFEDGQERLMQFVVIPVLNSTKVQFEVSCIHVVECLPARQYNKQRETLQQFKLPRRHLDFLRAHSHESLYTWMEFNHGLLMKCVQDYDCGKLLFSPGWRRTLAALPSYDLRIPGECPVRIDKSFYTYQQFRAQFTRIYIIDVVAIEMDAENELNVSDYYKKWKKAMKKLCDGQVIRGNFTIWSHLNSLEQSNQGDIRFIAEWSLPEKVTRMMFEQYQNDKQFAWSDIVSFDGVVAEEESSWNLLLRDSQAIALRELSELKEAIQPPALESTLSASINRESVIYLSCTRPVQLQSETAIVVTMNTQRRNEIDQYYLISADRNHIWCYESVLITNEKKR